MSKREDLFNELKAQNLISLYGDRVMFYDEGWGEIQFWKLEEISESVLCLKNNGVCVFFDRWEFSETGSSKSLHVFRGEFEVSEFKFPNKNKIIANHNHFYVEEFAVEMSDVLDKNVEQKGDWADSNWDTILSGLKGNLGKLKKKTEKEELKKSCIDLANYAVMMYYIFGGDK